MASAIQVRESQELKNSSQNSPLRELEGNPLRLTTLRYPLELGGDSVYKHIMRIGIYKQIKSEIPGPDVISGNAFDFAQKAGASKAKTIEDVGAGAVAVGAVKAVEGTAKITGVSQEATIVKEVASLGTAALNLQGASLERKTNKIASAFIALHMPEAVVYTDRHDFDTVSVTDALGAVGTAGGIVTGGAGTGEFTGKAAELSGAFGDRITDVSLFANGYAINPQLEVLYKGSKNREFVYQFKFVPRSQTEALELETIIRTLRYHAAPEYAISQNRSRYFVPPSEFEIEFFIGSQRNVHLPRISQAVLSNVDVNYSAGGPYSTYYDGTPIEISVQLSFTETIVLTKEDIRIGY